MKLQCEDFCCAKKGEPLYLYNDRKLCPFCLAAGLVESGQVTVANIGEQLANIKSRNNDTD